MFGEPKRRMFREVGVAVLILGLICVTGCKLTGYSSLLEESADTAGIPAPGGSPLGDFVDTPGFIVELTGDPVKAQFYTYRYHPDQNQSQRYRLLADLGSGYGGQGNPIISGRFFIPALVTEASVAAATSGGWKAGFAVKVWYDTPFGLGRSVRVFGRNGQELLLETKSLTIVNSIYRTVIGRATEAPAWENVPADQWGESLNPYRFADDAIDRRVRTGGLEPANDSGLRPRESRLFVTVKGGARSVRVLRDGKSLYSFGTVTDAESNGTYGVDLPDDFTFYIPADLSRLEELTLEAVYSDSEYGKIRAGQRRIVVFNQMGQRLREVRITRDYNPIRPEHSAYYDMRTHTAKLVVKNAKSLGLNAPGLSVSQGTPLEVSLSRTGVLDVVEGDRGILSWSTNRPTDGKERRNRVSIGFPPGLNPGGVGSGRYVGIQQAGGYMGIEFRTPPVWSPDEEANLHETGVMIYDGWGHTQWVPFSVRVVRHPRRDLPIATIVEESVTIAETDGGDEARMAGAGTSRQITVKFSGERKSGVRVPIQLPSWDTDYTVSGLVEVRGTKGYLEMGKDEGQKSFGVTAKNDNLWISGEELHTIRILAPEGDEEAVWRLPLATEGELRTSTILRITDDDEPAVYVHTRHRSDEYHRGALESGRTDFQEKRAFPLWVEVVLDRDLRENGHVGELPSGLSVNLKVDGSRSLFQGKDNAVYPVKYKEVFGSGFSAESVWVVEEAPAVIADNGDDADDPGEGIFSVSVFKKEENEWVRTTEGAAHAFLYLNEISEDVTFSVSLQPGEGYRMGDADFRSVVLKGIHAAPGE